GGLASTGTFAVIINGGPNDKINLRGLLIDGVGSGNTAIQFNSGAALNIQDCVVRNFLFGISMSTTGQLHVSDTIVADMTTTPPWVGNGKGIRTAPAAGSATAVLSRVRVNNAFAVGLAAGRTSSNSAVINVTVEDSVFSSSSGGTGVLVSAP